jgi:hypothetical protein
LTRLLESNAAAGGYVLGKRFCTEWSSSGGPSENPPSAAILLPRRSSKILQNFSDSPSHRIFRRMHEVLNIDKNKN